MTSNNKLKRYVVNTLMVAMDLAGALYAFWFYVWWGEIMSLARTGLIILALVLIAANVAWYRWSRRRTGV